MPYCEFCDSSYDYHGSNQDSGWLCLECSTMND